MKSGMWLVIGLLVGGTALAGEVDKKTERTWKAKCASCHGADGKGQTEKGKQMKVSDMSTPAYQKKVTDEDIKKAINDGVNREKDGVKQEMDAYKDSLKPEQVDALVTYIRALAAK